MSGSTKRVFTESPRYYIIAFLSSVGVVGVNLLQSYNYADVTLYMVSYGILALFWVFLSIKALSWFSVVLTEERIIIRYGKRKQTVINRADVKGVHVKDYRTILLLEGDKEYEIRHNQLKNSDELTTILQNAFPAAIPPANILGTYTIEEKLPA